ncbi:MAG: SAM-dependent DNA methyltransferase, partial [Pseudonocardiaceae bacterium]
MVVPDNVLFFDKRQVRLDRPWTSKLWVYDFRTGQHFTLRQRKLAAAHLDDFVTSYRPGEPLENRAQTERFKAFGYDELVARDKANLDITWLRDPDLDDGERLQPPEVIAAEIVE